MVRRNVLPPSSAYKIEDGGITFLQNVSKILPRPHDVTSQKTVVFMFTAMRVTSLKLINKRNEFTKSVVRYSLWPKQTLFLVAVITGMTSPLIAFVNLFRRKKKLLSFSPGFKYGDNLFYPHAPLLSNCPVSSIWRSGSYTDFSQQIYSVI
jgi:hypothetical protein